MMALRPVEQEDLDLLLAWGQNPLIWEYMLSSRNGEFLTWEHHKDWWESRGNNRWDWMILLDGRRIGVSHFLKGSPYMTGSAEVGLYIGDVTLWGKGMGYQALLLTLERLTMISMMYFGLGKVYAVIHPRNIHSITIFTRAGFKKIGPARRGQELYERSLG